VLRVIAALRQVDDRGTSCTLSRHCYMIYGATWKDLSMEKRPCNRGVGVYHCRCPQHSSRVRSTGFTLVIGESASGVPRLHEDLPVLQSMP
jgi:hypothetical protein